MLPATYNSPEGDTATAVGVPSPIRNPPPTGAQVWVAGSNAMIMSLVAALPRRVSSPASTVLGCWGPTPSASQTARSVNAGVLATAVNPKPGSNLKAGWQVVMSAFAVRVKPVSPPIPPTTANPANPTTAKGTFIW